jgi:NAD(P)-dependent dehydrogenase (short-subunit alcohol dehydrogenase family)
MAGRLTLITGVGRSGQVGESVAEEFARRGDRLVLVSRQFAEVTERANALQAAGFEATPYACDLADPDAVRDLGERVARAHGDALNGLVNLAGGFFRSGAVVESGLEAWQQMTRINLVTAFLTTRAFLPNLRRTSGAIVYFASAAALPGASVAGNWAYAAAKGAVVTLMRSVASEERADGVRANAVAPISIRTAANLAATGDAVQYVEREDVARAAWYLCGDEARAITGQVVRLG